MSFTGYRQNAPLNNFYCILLDRRRSSTTWATLVALAGVDE
jgi:hypothetical protein